ncbi:MAG: hypothetical protein K9N10_22295 [Deltaproteobacteria bacterium]|nr:hypothetical protein [Deltaproteobacteria bacterium]
MIDLVDDSYSLLPGDEVNVPSASGSPMLTLQELALAYAASNTLRKIISEPQIVMKIGGDAVTNERITCMVRGVDPKDGQGKEFWITCETDQYFEEDDMTLAFIALKDIRQFFIISGYEQVLRDAIELVEDTIHANIAAEMKSKIKLRKKSH